MGFGGISLWQLLIILAIIILVFGTKKLRNFGSDLGGAVRDFKGAMKEGEEAASQLEQNVADEQTAEEKKETNRTDT